MKALFTAYCDVGITASGTRTRELTCAAPKEIPFGTKIRVSGTGTSYDGKTYEVKILGISETEPMKIEKAKAPVVAAPAAPKASEAPKAATPVGEGTPVNSPMQGTILEIKVKVGDSVKSGDNLVILEAMKLENEIKAPKDGVVKEIRVSK